MEMDKGNSNCGYKEDVAIPAILRFSVIWLFPALQ